MGSSASARIGWVGYGGGYPADNLVEAGVPCNSSSGASTVGITLVIPGTGRPAASPRSSAVRNANP